MVEGPAQSGRMRSLMHLVPIPVAHVSASGSLLFLYRISFNAAATELLQLGYAQFPCVYPNMEKARTVLVQVNSLELGGTQINAIDLAKSVEVHGFRSVVFGPLNTLPKTGPNLMEIASERGVTLKGYWPRANVLPAGARALSARATSINADIIHVYGAYNYQDFRSAYWGPCFLGRRPFVHTVYEMSVESGLYRNTSLIIGTGYLRDELAIRPGPTTLISPPVNLEADAPNAYIGQRFRMSLADLGTRPVIAVVSRLSYEMKSYPVETAIRAMTLLADTEALLVVVGAGSAESHLKGIGRSVNANAGRTMVVFTGAMLDPRPVYAAADIMLGMGGSAARSLAFGAPLIVQGEGGSAELFEERTAADLFRRSFWSQHSEVDAPRVLADLVRQLLDRPAQRTQLGQFGRRFAVNNFSLAAMAERLATVYDESMARYGRIAWLCDLNRELPRVVEYIDRRLGKAETRSRQTTNLRP